MERYGHSLFRVAQERVRSMVGVIEQSAMRIHPDKHVSSRDQRVGEFWVGERKHHSCDEGISGRTHQKEPQEK